MTIIVKIKKGDKYTLWNVTDYKVTEKGGEFYHSNVQPTTIIQGYIEKVERKG